MGANSGEDLLGTYKNGFNCGRWVQVTLGKKLSDGSNDAYTGKSFYAVVSDSMGSISGNTNYPVNIGKPALDDLGIT